MFRHKLRSLVLLVLFAAMGMGLIVLSRRNEQLRRELAAERAKQSSLIASVAFAPSLIKLSGSVITVNGPGQLQFLSAPTEAEMPRGEDAFAK
jgi:hypothetical protein